ncbi:MAG: hypothetical protein LBD46_08515 [Endomicrobium sp.]|jgi:hypothetical protein|nr:hypothetical protein [Endomicrobium sp.]
MKKNKKESLRKSDWLYILASPQGRRVLGEVVERSGTLKVNHNENEILLAKCEGSRSVGLDILNTILEYKPSAFTQMLAELASLSNSQQKDLEEQIKKNDDLGLHNEQQNEE